MMPDNNSMPTAEAKKIADAVTEMVMASIEERWGDLFQRLALVTKIRTSSNSTRRDVALILHRLDGDAHMPAGGIEVITIKGVRREQFLRMCEIKKVTPELPLRASARQAISEIAGENGYRDEDAFAEYAALHRSWRKPVRKWTRHQKEADVAIDEKTEEVAI